MENLGNKDEYDLSWINVVDAAKTDIEQIIKLSDYRYEDDDKRKELHSLYTLTTYNTWCKIQIQGNCKDHWRDNDFILLQLIINETDEGSEMVKAYNKCFRTDITEPLIELEEKIEEECKLPETSIVKYIDIPEDSPKPLKHVVSTPLIKSKYKMRKISPLKLNRPPKKTDVESNSDRSKSDLEFAKTLDQTMKDNLLSLQATISETKDNMVQVIEDIKCSYKNELKVLKDLIEGKFQDCLDELNKLKHEKQSLEGKVNTLNGNVKSLEQTNKSLKDALTDMEGRMNILFQDKQLMEGKFCTFNDRCKSLEQSNQFLTDNLSKISTEFATFKQEINKRDSYQEKVTEQNYIDNENVSKIITEEEHKASSNIKQDTKFDMVVFMDSNRRYINMSNLASGRNNKLVPCGSIANAKEYIESVQYLANTILLHLGVNDVEQTQDQQKIAIDFIEVCKMTREKFPDASIIISELTPRQDDLQNVIKKVNIEINQRIKKYLIVY